MLITIISELRCWRRWWGSGVLAADAEFEYCGRGAKIAHITECHQVGWWGTVSFCYIRWWCHQTSNGQKVCAWIDHSLKQKKTQQLMRWLSFAAAFAAKSAVVYLKLGFCLVIKSLVVYCSGVLRRLKVVLLFSCHVFISISHLVHASNMCGHRSHTVRKLSWQRC